MTKEAVIYARVSTKDQEREGYSIPAQLEYLETYAQKNKLKVVHKYQESETAAKSGRTEFAKMVAEIKKKSGPKIVLVEKTDRLTRNFKDYVLLDELAKDYGIEFHLVKDNEILGANASSSKKLMMGIRVALASNYIDNLKEEISKGILQKVKSGGWNWRAPYGYTMVKKELHIDLERAYFVQRAFELAATGGYSLDAIAEELYQSGLIYQPSKPKVSKTHLHKILRHRIYMGQIEYQGQIYEGNHQPIVSADTWHQAQPKGSKTSKIIGQHKKAFMFRDVITCGACGSVLSGEEKKDGRYVYYRCWQAANRKCDQPYISQSAIIKEIDRLVERMQFPAEYKHDLLALVEEMEDPKMSTAHEEKKKVDAQIARLQAGLKQAYKDRTLGIIGLDMYQEIQADFQTQMDELYATRARIDKADVPYYQLACEYLELPEIIGGTWQNGNEEEKAILMKLITSNFSVTNKKVVIELLSPFNHFFNDMDLTRKEAWWSIGDSNS